MSETIEQPSNVVEQAATNKLPINAEKKRAASLKQTQVAKKVAIKPSTRAKKSAKTVVKSKRNKKHPTFLQMITEAITRLNERSGSSRQAILKFIVANFKIEEKFGSQHVKLALKNAVKVGTLKQVKGIGASGSFKLGEALKTKTAYKQLLSKKPVKKAAAKVSTPALKVVKVIVSKVKRALAEVKPKKNVKRVVKPKSPAKAVVKAKPATKKVAKGKKQTARK